MEKFVLILVLFFFLSPLSQGQSVQVQEDYEVSRLLERFVSTNKSQNSVSGWRIQILSTTDRMRMEQAKQDFLAKYPAEKVEWEHAKPYYRLRVGAFSTKLEAMQLLYQLKREYPSAYPAVDTSINPRDFLR